MSYANRGSGRRPSLAGMQPWQSPADLGLNVTAGDVRPLLAILAGDSVLTTHLGWQRAALCAEVSLEFFYPEPGSDGSDARAARSVCAGCPVRRDCLLDALEHMDDFGPGTHGLWGSTSPWQREYFLKVAGGDARAALGYAMRCDPLDNSRTPQPRELAA